MDSAKDVHFLLLFMELCSHSIDDVKWDGKTIVVLGDVNIVEPYSESDLKAISGRSTNTVDHISKIVSIKYTDACRK